MKREQKLKVLEAFAAGEGYPTGLTETQKESLRAQAASALNTHHTEFVLASIGESLYRAALSIARDNAKARASVDESIYAAREAAIAAIAAKIAYKHGLDAESARTRAEAEYMEQLRKRAESARKRAESAFIALSGGKNNGDEG